MSASFEGRTAIVTGAAGGIGLAVARRLAAGGADVILTDVQDEMGEAAAAGIGARYRRCDVADEADWEALLELAPRLDILVNNAGIIPKSQDFATFSLADWRRVHAVNLDGVFLGCRFAVRVMGKRGGSIINMASAGGLRPHADFAAYCSSKAAVSTLTKAVALYCGKSGLPIRCNAVLPGAVDTPMTQGLRAASADPEAARKATLEAYPIGFIAEPDDIAGVVAFLASDDARFMTGSQVVVDGGFTI